MSQVAEPWTVQKTLDWTLGFFTRKGVDAPRLSAELLLAHVLGIARIKLYTDYQRVLLDEERGRLRDLVTRAAEHEPIAYLTGRAHFFNLELQVTRDVLIPRPDTETLVENVITAIRRQMVLENPRILDLCTGSGCIPAALAHNLKTAIILATEISPAAAEVARGNLARLGLAERVTVVEGDLFEPLGQLVDARRFDIITANPPYIASADIDQLDRSVRDYEPRLALDGGPDGLAIVRRILQQAPEHLADPGRIFIEIAFNEGESAAALASELGWQQVRVLKDHAGNDRVLTASRT